MAELNEKELDEVAGGAYDKYEEYICLRGDTLNRISYIYGTSPAFLINLNNLTTPNLTPGQKLLVPKKKK